MKLENDLETQMAQLKLEHQRASVLLGISLALNSARNDDEILSALNQYAIEHGVAAAALLYIDSSADGRPEWAQIAAIWQRPGSGEAGFTRGMRFYLPDFPSHRIWLADPNHAQLIPDVANDPELDEGTRQLYLARGTQAAAAIPLTRSGQWLGLLSFSWHTPHAFSDQEVVIYDSLPALAGPSVENRRLLASMENIITENTAKLTESRYMLETILNTIPVGVFWKDRDGRFMGCNQLVARDAGLGSPAEIVGKVDEDFAWGDHAAEYRANDLSVIESGQPRLNFEEPLTRSDGSQGWVRTSKIPLRDAHGEIIGVLGMYEDITAQKQAENSLRDSQWRLELAIKSAKLGLWDWDLSTNQVVFYNQDLPRMLGYEPGELAGDRDVLTAMVHPDDLESMLAALQAHFADPSVPYTTEGRLRMKDGTWKWVLGTGMVIERSADGQPLRMIGTYQDIDQQKRFVEERERLQQEVIEAQRQALAELSTPIIPIMDRIIVLPLVGGIDTRRARDVMRAVLEGITRYRAKIVILDITGVPVVDSGVADHLNRTIQAARLKGAHTIVTGITDAVAETIVDLGIDWHMFETLRDLQSGLILALDRVGYRLQQVNNGHGRQA